MLVLSRKVGEEILIGDSIRVRVLEVSGSRVKLGFVAPQDVRLQRTELVERSELAERVHNRLRALVASS
jgi:carbon storage regulator